MIGPRTRLIPVFVLLGLLFAPGRVYGEYPPKVVGRVQLDMPPQRMAASASNLYVTDGDACRKLDLFLGDHGLFATQICYPRGIAAASQFVYLSPFAGSSGCPPDQIYKVGLDGRVARQWCRFENGCGARDLALDADGNVYASHGRKIRKFDPQGALLATWEEPAPPETHGGFWGITVGPGAVYALNLDTQVLRKLDTDLASAVDLVPRGTGNAEVRWPLDLSADPDGNLFVVDDLRIKKFSSDGSYLVSWRPDDPPVSVATDVFGYVYVGTEKEGTENTIEYGIIKYDNLPGSPPEEPVPPHPPALFFHVGPRGGSRLACDAVPENPVDIVTLGEADPSAPRHYYVYILASPDTRETTEIKGITGVQLGLEYAIQGDHPQGIDVYSWTTCSVLDFPQSTWPDSGSGNTITWTVNPSTCQEEEVVLTGFMYVDAFGPALMWAGDFPGGRPPRSAKVTNCDGAELVVQKDQRGWISFGGATRYGSTAGCNPLYEPCTSPTAVNPTTWGRIKTKYEE